MRNALLVTDSAGVRRAVAREVARQRASLSRSAILDESIAHMRLMSSIRSTAFEIANEYAPSTCCSKCASRARGSRSVTAAGAVFLGSWSPESMGDYCSGPNHTLPTYGYARAYSGLSLEDFQKRITVQELTPAGLRDSGPTAQTLAGSRAWTRMRPP
jgi:histidinol dehydrogenase